MHSRSLAIVAGGLLIGCAAPPPDDLGLRDGRLAGCPSSPNCVSTEADDSRHATAPFVLALPPDEAWKLARVAVESLPGAKVVLQTGDYMHAECTTPLMRYVDDLELQLRPDEGRLEVRSASRVGWYDMGANRERVWELRQLLEAGTVIVPVEDED